MKKKRKEVVTVSEILDTLIEEQEALNNQRLDGDTASGVGVKEESSDTESPHGDSNSLSNDEKKPKMTFSDIQDEVELEVREIMHGIGHLHYRLAKFLYEKSELLDDRERAKMYRWISEYTGFSVKTLKNIVYVYRKLCKFISFYALKGFTKWKLFQIAYYMSKKTDRMEDVMRDIYKRIMTDRNMLQWFEYANYKDIVKWVKEDYKEYIKYYPKTQVIFTCACCNAQLPHETRGETWDLIPVHYDCFDILKDSNPSKVGKLLKNHREVVQSEEYRVMKAQIAELQEIKERLVEELIVLRRNYEKLKKEYDRLKRENRWLKHRYEECMKKAQ